MDDWAAVCDACLRARLPPDTGSHLDAAWRLLSGGPLPGVQGHADTLLTDMECDRLFEYALGCCIASLAGGERWSDFLVRYVRSGGPVTPPRALAGLLLLLLGAEGRGWLEDGLGAGMARCDDDAPRDACLVVFRRPGSTTTHMPPSHYDRILGGRYHRRRGRAVFRSPDTGADVLFDPRTGHLLGWRLATDPRDAAPRLPGDVAPPTPVFLRCAGGSARCVHRLA